MVCNSLPNLNSRTSPMVTASEVDIDNACKSALRKPNPGVESRRIVTATSGVEPFAIWCLYEVRTTAFGIPGPYPKSPPTRIVSEAKNDFSRLKPVLMSDPDPKP